ncbi:unnamed protein product [Clonostachys rosea]|uniref:MalT-like TPR region domain-containing protein n=1 Tax=Bionectria ochroleuca TaxID=29856 RepID=A0ABY6TQD3_BIOOC|nr:unnamed protein product [Clonostachys rosea]
MSEEEILSVHRVVQSARLQMLTDTNRQEAFNTTLTILSACFPRQKSGDHMNADWNDCERFFAHVLAFDTAVQNWNPVLADYEAYINLICDVTWYLWEIGQYDEALGRLNWIEEICEKTIGLDTLEAARVYVNRGSVFSSLNRYDEAGQLFQKGLTIRQTLLPADDQLLGNSYMQVGNYYASQGKIEEAIRSHRQVIRIRESSPETPPGIMIISYFNICRCLLLGTQLAEAERMLEMAQLWENKLNQEESLYHKNG